MQIFPLLSPQGYVPQSGWGEIPTEDGMGVRSPWLIQSFAVLLSLPSVGVLSASSGGVFSEVATCSLVKGQRPISLPKAVSWKWLPMAMHASGAAYPCYYHMCYQASNKDKLGQDFQP